MTYTEQARLWELAARLGVTHGASIPSHLTDPARTHLDDGSAPYRPIHPGYVYSRGQYPVPSHTTDRRLWQKGE